MFELELLDLSTNKRFTKQFTSYYLYQKFKNKLKHSKKLIMIGWNSYI
mgnify:CR=1 FL=1